jgi:undecaprenyl-diphosphatase
VGSFAQAGRRLNAVGRASLRLAGGDVRLLLAALFVVASVWGFIEIADAVSGGATQAFDEKVLRFLRETDDVSKVLGPRWLRGSMRDITALGGATVLVLVSLAVVVYLALRRQYHALALVLAAIIGGRLLNVALKALFDRPRPDVLFHLTEVNSPSFPSGHAMDSAVIYLTLAALLTRLVKTRVPKMYFIAIAMCATFLIGVSRVYLGVHYPSDVLAGWMAGLAWAVLCWAVATYLQRRGAVEKAS